jgi:mitogen-activated protein kinase kinase kinase 7
VSVLALVLCPYFTGPRRCAKIADFGLTARVTERLRTPLETWQWMAPEAQQGLDYTESCDLYSYGVILYEVYSGMVPFSEYAPAMRLIEIKQAVLAEPFLRPTMPSTAPQWISRLALRLWHQDPSMRPSFADCLRIMQREIGIQPDLPL